MMAPSSSNSIAPRFESSSFNRRASAMAASLTFGRGMINIGRIGASVNTSVERRIAAH
jgi:hypothetical protein